MNFEQIERAKISHSARETRGVKCPKKVIKMVEELQDIKEIKSLVSSTLLALGKRATEREFRKNFYEQESESFNVILARFNKSFYQFMKSIPDVCRLTVVEDEIILERVTKSESAHMDNLSIEKKRIRPKSR